MMKELLILSLVLLGWIKTTEETEPIQITKTNYTNIFLPEGEIIPKSDFATLKILVNVTAIFDESNKVCHISDVINSFVKKRTKKLSAPNQRILDVIQKNINAACENDKEALLQIKTSYGLTDVGIITKRQKRQFIVAATVIVTSLVTYFTTKELISMSGDDDNDELYSTTNHIITAIKDHETRIRRIEQKQKNLEGHIKKLTGALIMGIKTQDIFYDMFAVESYAQRLSQHIQRLFQGLFVLLNTNKLHPNLVQFSELEKGIDALRKKALKASKKLLLHHPSDIFQLKADFLWIFSE